MIKKVGEKETPLGEKETPLGEKATKVGEKVNFVGEKKIHVISIPIEGLWWPCTGIARNLSKQHNTKELGKKSQTQLELTLRLCRRISFPGNFQQ